MGSDALSSWFSSWLAWALLSAAFAALTAIFAKIGVDDINPDLATLIRTGIVLASLAGILVGIIFARIAAEFVLIVFRINEHLGAIRDQGDRR